MFAPVVELYRSVGRPEVEGSRYSYNGPSSERIDDAIEACTGVDTHYGYFESTPGRVAGNVSFTWILGSNSKARFYRSLQDLVAGMQSIHRGKHPANFYLIEKDYAYGEVDPPADLVRLNSICDLIKNLSVLSGQVEEGAVLTQPLTLFFSLPAHSGVPAQAAKVVTKIEASSIIGDPLSLDDIKEVVNSDLAHVSHFRERQALLRVAIAHFLLGVRPSRYFSTLVAKWPQVVEKFRYDTECYVGQYSFENFTSKLAEAQAEFAGRLTKVMGDTATKFLALPLPFVALVGISRSDDILQSYLLFFGAIVLALLYAAQVRNQFLEVERIEHSFDLVFDRLRFLPKDEKVQDGASASLVRVRQGFYDQKKLLGRTLNILLGMAWMPIAGGLFMLAYKYHPGFQHGFHRFILVSHEYLDGLVGSFS